MWARLLLSLFPVAAVAGSGTMEMMKTTDVVRLEISQPQAGRVIGFDHPGLGGNKYGFEGGSALKVEETYHLFMAEMAGDPFWVTMRLGHWESKDLATWKRTGTLFESKGEGHNKDPKFSIWAPMPIYNEAEDRWNLFYVAYRGPLAPNEGTHMDGQIYRAVSQTPGPLGVGGPYEDAGVILRPDSLSQPWEGQQGTDSFYPYQVGNEWYGFYGSHNYHPLCPWLVGLAKAPTLAGPWLRCTKGNPSGLEKHFIENPIVHRVGELYLTVYDSSEINAQGDYVESPFDVGYACSKDGSHWLEGARCVLHPDAPASWSSDMRTPLGLIPLEGGEYAMPYTAKDKDRMFWSVGVAKVRLVRK